MTMPAGGQPLITLTIEGGLAVWGINKTGAVSVRGTIVSPGSEDLGFIVTPGDAEYPTGVVIDSGIPDGGRMWVVVSGCAHVLLKDGEASTHGYWVGVSDTAGRCFTNNSVPGTPTHNREIGHCLETKAAGVSVLAKVLLHFN